MQVQVIDMATYFFVRLFFLILKLSSDAIGHPLQHIYVRGNRMEEMEKRNRLLVPDGNCSITMKPRLEIFNRTMRRVRQEGGLFCYTTHRGQNIGHLAHTEERKMSRNTKQALTGICYFEQFCLYTICFNIFIM